MSHKDYYEEEKNHEQILNKKTDKEFDEYMCEKYPSYFKERHLPMNQTCMCWGFCIGKGWHYLLDKACRMVQLIEKLTGATVIFKQIKEKYGSACFYHQTDTSKSTLSENEQFMIHEILSMIIDNAERKTDNICAECGEYYYHEKIVIGHWVYDICEECFLKLYPNRTDELKIWQEHKEFIETFNHVSHYFNEDDKAKILEIIKTVEERWNNISNLPKNEKDNV